MARPNRNSNRNNNSSNSNQDSVQLPEQVFIPPGPLTGYVYSIEHIETESKGHGVIITCPIKHYRNKDENGDPNGAVWVKFKRWAFEDNDTVIDKLNYWMDKERGWITSKKEDGKGKFIKFYPASYCFNMYATEKDGQIVIRQDVSIDIMDFSFPDNSGFRDDDDDDNGGGNNRNRNRSSQNRGRAASNRKQAKEESYDDEDDVDFWD